MTKIPRDKLDALVKRLARKYTSPMIDSSLRNMAEEIKAETGVEPSTSVLAASLRRVGAKANGRRWVWLHNPGRGE